MSGGDVVIGKLTPLPEDEANPNPRVTHRDASVYLRNAESGVVDQVLITTNADRHKFVKMRVRSIRIP